MNLGQFHHHQLHLHQESTAYCQETTPFFIFNSENLQDTSADNTGMTKSELKEVIHLIQNTMETLTIFEKCFSNQ